MGTGKTLRGQKLNLLFFFLSQSGKPLTSVTFYKAFNPSLCRGKQGANGEKMESLGKKCFLPSSVGEPLNG